MDEQPVIGAVFTGTVTISERREAVQEIVKCSEASGVLRLLADFRRAYSEPKSQLETATYAEWLAAEPAMRKLKIAYLGTAEQTAGVETVAALRGYFYQRFTDEASALRWLQ